MHIFDHGLNQHFDAVLPVLFALYTKESLTIFSFSIELEHHRMGDNLEGYGVRLGILRFGIIHKKVAHSFSH